MKVFLFCPAIYFIPVFHTIVKLDTSGTNKMTQSSLSLSINATNAANYITIPFEASEGAV